jgi:hypothetical protein
MDSGCQYNFLADIYTADLKEKTNEDVWPDNQSESGTA